MKGEPIEIAYQSLCEEFKEPRLDLYHVYEAAKSRLETRYYPYIIYKQPYMTDHGPGHIRRILEKLSGLLTYHIPSTEIEQPKERLLNIIELDLLLNSVIWHDIGNLYGRENHAQSIHNIFDQIKGFLYDGYQIEWIAKIAKAHSGKDSIESNIEIESTYVHDLPVRPRFLAALLRIADEVEEDQRRIGEKVYDDVPDDNKVYWFFCKCNQSVRVVQALEGCTLSVDCKIQKEEIWSRFNKEAGDKGVIQIPGIEEYINRLKTINEERIYCNKFLERSHYYPPIRWIDLDLKIYDEDNIVNQIEYRFINRDDFQQFLKEHDRILALYR